MWFQITSVGINDELTIYELVLPATRLHDRQNYLKNEMRICTKACLS